MQITQLYYDILHLEINKFTYSCKLATPNGEVGTSLYPSTLNRTKHHFVDNKSEGITPLSALTLTNLRRQPPKLTFHQKSAPPLESSLVGSDLD
jgi:hypothetical protein